MTQIKYIHIHVPKNGGSTFNAILARHFGAQNMSNYKFSPGQIFSEDEKRNCLAAYPDCACINGHVFRFPGPVLPDTEYRYLTFLRQPIARLMSLYAYERKTSDPSHCSHRSFEEWIDIRLTSQDNALTNYQTFHICGGSLGEPFDFELARRILDTFFFVGIIEDFDNSLLVLAYKMKLSALEMNYRTVNATNSRSMFSINPQTRQRLEELNQIDMQLYEYAYAQHQQNLKGLGRGRLIWEQIKFSTIRLLPVVALNMAPPRRSSGTP